MKKPDLRQQIGFFPIPSLRKVIELVKGERFSLGLATLLFPRRQPCWLHLKMTHQRNPGKSSELNKLP